MDRRSLYALVLLGIVIVTVLKSTSDSPSTLNRNQRLAAELESLEEHESRFTWENDSVEMLEILLLDQPGRSLNIATFRKGDFSNSEPVELQYSCAVCLTGDEEALADSMARGLPDERTSAAKTLWLGNSRRHARAVIQYALENIDHSTSHADFKRSIEASLEPAAIRKELHTDYRWGVWLAGLRPHETLVPELLDALESRIDEQAGTIFALGKSRDARAFQPLVRLLKSSDDMTVGYAAKALADLQLEEAEKYLLEAVFIESAWAKANVCNALGRIGSRIALPALQELVDAPGSPGGAINVSRIAGEAIDQINVRHR